jgi:hypothetical protein
MGLRTKFFKLEIDSG